MCKIVINHRLRDCDELNMNILKQMLLFKKGHIVDILVPEEVASIQITDISEVRDLGSNAPKDNDDSLFNYLMDYKRDLLVIR